MKRMLQFGIIVAVLMLAFSSVYAHDDHEHDGDGLDIDLFFEGALAEEPEIVDCTLSDGTETSCYEITVVGYPADYDAGPFCPETTSDTAEAGGIWFDGNDVYDIDGDFILGLVDLYDDENWQLYDEDGNVNITDTEEAFDAAARPDVDPEYQNHCVEGRLEWLENGEPIPTTVLIPTTPVVGDDITQSNGNRGITLNGVVIAASAPVDAILSAYTIAAFDDCGGHFNPFDGYHLHGAVGCSEAGEAIDGETPIFAYALDGFPIHSPLDEEAAQAADLDECGGHTTEELRYHYHANAAEENNVLTCFTGLIVASDAADHNDEGGRPEGGPPGGEGRPEGGPPGG
ncbi:MAG: YHYH protein, partial [Aggregatilineales bacterium]